MTVEDELIWLFLDLFNVTYHHVVHKHLMRLQFFHVKSAWDSGSSIHSLCEGIEIFCVLKNLRVNCSITFKLVIFISFQLVFG